MHHKISANSVLPATTCNTASNEVRDRATGFHQILMQGKAQFQQGRDGLLEERKHSSDEPCHPAEIRPSPRNDLTGSVAHLRVRSGRRERLESVQQWLGCAAAAGPTPGCLLSPASASRQG